MEVQMFCDDCGQEMRVSKVLHMPTWGRPRNWTAVADCQNCKRVTKISIVIRKMKGGING